MRALIAMSGGVDSSVAALLTREQGFECVGCTMRLCPPLPASDPGEADRAALAAEHLGIPFLVFDDTREFRERIIGPFVRDYAAGRTPNPCVECNRCLKFGRLHRRAEELGFDRLVTGHYARIGYEEGRYTLRRARDLARDQSYFLFRLTQDQLSRTLFPLGELEKTEVRALARERGLPSADRRDSQDICFVPDGDYAAVIARYSDALPPEGDFLSTDGRVLGRHRGIFRYTVGQRRGLGVSAPAPLYVCSIDPAANTVTLGANEDLFRSDADVGDVHWISETAPEAPIRCKAKIRYRHREQWASIVPGKDRTVHLRFDEPQRAITPGQSAVFYDGDTVLGGGTIL